MYIALVLATLLMVTVTVLPLLRHPAWWIRVWDFPRLQLSSISLLLIAFALLLGDADPPRRGLLLGPLLAVLAYHAWWITPYTRLRRVEVGATTKAARPRRLRILTVNVLGTNRDSGRLLEIIRRHEPDLFVAVESNAWWEARLDELAPAYPYAPTERDVELILVGKSVAGSDAPVVVAGDLNDVAWSRTTRLFRKISGLLDPRGGRGMYNTYHAKIPLVRWPLDHLFHSRHFSVTAIERLAAFGSDHFPIVVELQLGGTEGNEPPLRASGGDMEWANEVVAKGR